MYDEARRWLDEVLGNPARPPSGYRTVGPVRDDVTSVPNMMRTPNDDITIDTRIGPVDGITPTYGPGGLVDYMRTRAVKG